MHTLALALSLSAPAMAATLDGPADFGTSLAQGDYDGDGIPDLAVGTPALDLVWIFYGGDDGLSWSRAHRVAGDELGARFGQDLDAADLDGDGIDDLIVGAPAAREGGGCLSTWPGGTAGIATSPAFTACSDRGAIGLAIAVAAAGDLDGDGAPDLIAGSQAPFLAIYFGGPDGFSEEARTIVTSGSTTFQGDRCTEVAAGRDLNDDGVADALVSDDDATGGRTLVIHGDPEGIRDGVQSPTSLVSTGPTRALLGPGDLDGDGRDDAVVTSYLLSACSVLLFSGGSGSAELLVDGEYDDGCIGSALASADLDGDGRLDLAATEPGADTPALHLIYGGSDGFTPTVRPLVSDVLGDGGRALAVLDLDADGFPEIAVGDPGELAGRVHLLQGGPDQDRDGAVLPEDCDDTDPGVYPGAEEIPGDGVDQDCDGQDASTDTGTPDTGERDSRPDDDTGTACPDDSGSPCDDDHDNDGDDGSGCGCDTPGSPASTGIAGLLTLLALMLARARRRQGASLSDR